jgi:hypothetical protein
MIVLIKVWVVEYMGGSVGYSTRPHTISSNHNHHTGMTPSECAEGCRQDPSLDLFDYSNYSSPKEFEILTLFNMVAPQKSRFSVIGNS